MLVYECCRFMNLVSLWMVLMNVVEHILYAFWTMNVGSIGKLMNVWTILMNVTVF